MTNPTDLLGEIPSQPTDASFLQPLANHLARAGRWGELLEVRLVEARLAVGLAVDASSQQLPEGPARDELERRYAAACEEAGRGLLAEQKWADAWRYLSAAGRPEPLRDALDGLQPDEAAADELIEVALYHQANPAAGFRWMLTHYGACNAVTTLEGLGPELKPEELQACAALLVEHLHDQLLAAVKAHIAQAEGAAPGSDGLPALVQGRPWLFDGEGSHVDASHLAAAVRMARVLTDEGDVSAAFALADYGARLHESLHFGDAPPFEDIFRTHRRFYAAQLGQAVDEAIAYFQRRAEEAKPERDGLAALETLLVLLHRLGRGEEALQQFGRLAPTEVDLLPHAPQPLELARASGAWDVYDRVMTNRGDAVAVAKGRLARLEP